jgi:hypothetical protein
MCVYACVRACVRACVFLCVCICVCAFADFARVLVPMFTITSCCCRRPFPQDEPGRTPLCIMHGGQIPGCPPMPELPPMADDGNYGDDSYGEIPEPGGAGGGGGAPPRPDVAVRHHYEGYFSLRIRKAPVLIRVVPQPELAPFSRRSLRCGPCSRGGRRLARTTSQRCHVTLGRC